MSSRIPRGQRNRCWFLERPAKRTHCPIPPKERPVFKNCERRINWREAAREKKRDLPIAYISLHPLLAKKPKWFDSTYINSAPNFPGKNQNINWLYMLSFINFSFDLNYSAFLKGVYFLSLFNHVLLSYKKEKKQQQTGSASTLLNLVTRLTPSVAWTLMTYPHGWGLFGTSAFPVK